MSNKKIDKQMKDECFDYYKSNHNKVKEDKIVMSLLNDNELAAIDRFIDLYKKELNVRNVGCNTNREATIADILRGALFSGLMSGVDRRDALANDIGAYYVMRNNSEVE